MIKQAHNFKDSAAWCFRADYDFSNHIVPRHWTCVAYTFFYYDTVPRHGWGSPSITSSLDTGQAAATAATICCLASDTFLQLPLNYLDYPSILKNGDHWAGLRSCSSGRLHTTPMIELIESLSSVEVGACDVLSSFDVVLDCVRWTEAWTNFSPTTYGVFILSTAYLRSFHPSRCFSCAWR